MSGVRERSGGGKPQLSLSTLKLIRKMSRSGAYVWLRPVHSELVPGTRPGRVAWIAQVEQRYGSDWTMRRGEGSTAEEAIHDALET